MATRSQAEANGKKSETEEEEEKPLLSSCTVEGLAEYMELKGDKLKIVVMTGAGLSTAAGIPDFRSPGTGLYDNLQKYNLPSPQSIFELGYFQSNPEPFFRLAHGMWPGEVLPTLAHYFIRLLDEEGMLLKLFTQNIDTLERLTGLRNEKIIEAHGSFNSGHCLRCRKLYSYDWMKERILVKSEDETPPIPLCEEEDCQAANKEKEAKGWTWEDMEKEADLPSPIVKPDIVFFGENLPASFVEGVALLQECDLLIIMGTSLVVHPFASLVQRVNKNTPRVLMNLEAPEHMMAKEEDPIHVLMYGDPFLFNHSKNTRDVFLQGKCDDSCLALAKILGLEPKLQKLMKEGHQGLKAKQTSTSPAKSSSTTKVPVKVTTKTPTKSPTKTATKSPNKTPPKSPAKTPTKSPPKTSTKSPANVSPQKGGGDLSSKTSSSSQKTPPGAEASGSSKEMEAVGKVDEITQAVDDISISGKSASLKK